MNNRAHPPHRCGQHTPSYQYSCPLHAGEIEPLRRTSTRRAQPLRSADAKQPQRARAHRREQGLRKNRLCAGAKRNRRTSPMRDAQPKSIAGAHKQKRIARTSGAQTSPPARTRCLTCTPGREGRNRRTSAPKRETPLGHRTPTFNGRLNIAHIGRAARSLRHSAKRGPAQPRASPAHEGGLSSAKRGAPRRVHLPRPKTGTPHASKRGAPHRVHLPRPKTGAPLARPHSY